MKNKYNTMSSLMHYGKNIFIFKSKTEMWFHKPRKKAAYLYTGTPISISSSASGHHVSRRKSKPFGFCSDFLNRFAYSIRVKNDDCLLLVLTLLGTSHWESRYKIPVPGTHLRLQMIIDHAVVFIRDSVPHARSLNSFAHSDVNVHWCHAHILHVRCGLVVGHLKLIENKEPFS